jgi:hypothetical protein
MLQALRGVGLSKLPARAAGEDGTELAVGVALMHVMCAVSPYQLMFRASTTSTAWLRQSSYP